jgi:hypothetical protein
MRALIGIVVGVAASSLATATVAQSSQASGGFPAEVRQGGDGSFVPGVATAIGERGAPLGGAVVPTRYEFALAMLQADVDRLTRSDGGHLTSEHQAGFQKDLDDLNRHFHKGPYAR